MRNIAGAVLLASIIASKAFQPTANAGRDGREVSLCDEQTRSNLSRRNFFGLIGAIGTTALLAPEGASAAMSQEEKDKKNMVKGYERLQYLLDNWEKETTVCKTGTDSFGNACERNPLKVMDYMGFKSIDDPLYKADKAMMRLYPLVPTKYDAEYAEAVDLFTENSEEASGMAFISSWGEANPGGGKDRVELFIERSRNNVITSRDCLATIIKILDLKS